MAFVASDAKRRYSAAAGICFLFLLLLMSRSGSPETGRSSTSVVLQPAEDEAYGPDETGDSSVELSESEVNRRDGKRMSEYIADEKIRAVKKQLGKERGPFIVGGIGDSGTRGFWDVLMKLGVYMQGEENVRGDSRDSLVFMARRPTIQSDGSVLQRSPSALYNEPMSKARSIKYNSTHVRAERWQCGRQFIADTVQRIMNDTIAKRLAKGRPNLLHPFGFKHPRTALLMPYFVASLGNKFAFIHVVRDGREVAAGDNDYLFKDHCQLYYGRKCSDAQAIDMWADLNQEVLEYAMESPMLANQYFAMRVEDLVRGQRKCYEMLIKYLDLPEDMGFNLTERLEGAMKSSMTHAKSYFGQKYTYNDRLDMVARAGRKGRAALKFWGYEENKFGLKTDCDQLPWIDMLRRKKGTLLIDD